MENNDVRFIMKNGKIIPIKLKRNRQGEKEGAAKIGASVAVSSAGVYAAKRTLDKSAKSWKSYHEAMPFEEFWKSSSKVIKDARKGADLFESARLKGIASEIDTDLRKSRVKTRSMLKSAIKNVKRSKFLLKGSIALGAFGVASGITDVLPTTNQDWIETKKDEIGGLAAGAFGLAAPLFVGRFTKVKVKARNFDNLYSAWSRKGKRLSHKTRVRQKTKIVNALKKEFGIFE